MNSARYQDPYLAWIWGFFGSGLLLTGLAIPGYLYGTESMELGAISVRYPAAARKLPLSIIGAGLTLMAWWETKNREEWLEQHERDRLHALQLGRYKQTAHHPNDSSGSVTITNPIHPLFGQTVGVRKIRRLGATVQVSLNHPDGGSFSLPANETSLGSDESLHLSSTKALLAVHQLLVLADWIAVHKRGSPNSANFGVQFEDGEVAQHIPHATPSRPAHRSSRRDKRPTTTTD